MDSSLSSRYSAHASRDFLILLDTTPSQDMLDEGIAREVINKIQKLRKKVCAKEVVKQTKTCSKFNVPQAGLKPSDPVDVLYEVSGDPGPTHSLQRVIQTHKQYIESTTKGPIVAAQQGAEKTRVIAEDKQMVIRRTHFCSILVIIYLFSF